MIVGLYKIDNVSSEEWQRRMMRRHHIRQWIILIGELILMTGVVLALIWIAGEIKP